MNINLNKETNSVYISLEEGEYDVSKKVSENVIVDLSKEGRVIGIEVLDAASSLDSDPQAKHQRVLV